LPTARFWEEAPDAETALALLQAVYRDKQAPQAVRIRCASEALPYEKRLSAMVVTSMNGNDFAKALEGAIQRSGKAPLMIDATATADDA
jgi:hypothetical protein